MAPATAVAAEYHVDPSRGSDANPGTAEEPWRTLGAHTNNNINETPILAGDVITLHEGVHCQLRGELRGLVGTADEPIVIRAAPGERAELTADMMRCAKDPIEWVPITGEDCVSILEKDCVVPAPDDRDGACQDLAIEPATCDGTQIFRTANRVAEDPFHDSLPPLRFARGYGRRDGQWEQLIVYTRVADFVAPDLDGAPTPYFVGAGTFINDGYVYIRMHTPSEAQVGVPVIPYASLDPNELDLEIALGSDGGSAGLSLHSSEYVEFSGLVFRTFGGVAVSGRGGPINGDIGHITVRDATFDTTSGSIFLDAVHDIEIVGSSFTQRTPKWLAWSDTKDWRGAALGATSPALPINFDSYNVTVRDNRFEDVFDAINMLGENPMRAPHHIAITGNEFIGVRDDSINISWTDRFVEIADNYFWGVSKAVSRQGGGYPGEFPGDPHTVDIHHNRIDTGVPMLQRRAWDDGSAPRRNCHPAFGGHNVTGENTGPGPWRVYHNTIYGCTSHPNSLNNGTGVGLGYDGAESEGTPQLAYNNVIEFAGDALVQRSLIADGSAYYDGNVYWRRDDDPQGAFYFPILYGAELQPPQATFDSLAEARASTVFVERTTHESWAPAGWDALSEEADPQLTAGDCPAPGGPTALPRVDLSAFDLPAVDGSEDYVGAVDPNSTFCTLTRQLQIESTDGPPQDACPEGTTTFVLGLDDGDIDGSGQGVADNGILEPDEIDGEFTYCRTGDEPLLLQPTEMATECDDVGVRFIVGQDDGRHWATGADQRLGPGEVDARDFVCLGASEGMNDTGDDDGTADSTSGDPDDGATSSDPDGTGDGPNGANDDPSGCQCRATRRSPSTAWLLLGVLASARRRRRRRRTTAGHDHARSCGTHL